MARAVTLRADGQPNAKITASGDLQIGGKAVAVNASQRMLLQSYHHEMNAMTADGLAIGKQGAALAGKAVSEAIKSAMRGDGESIDSKIEADTKKIEQQAMQLCKRLATLKTSQDALAAQFPEFKPYATLDLKDVDDCGSDQRESYDAGKKVGGSLARVVKDAKDDGATHDAAKRADTAADEAAADRDADTH